ncbi:MAG TPA: ester cyclase [Nocardioides sp.]|uniref:ester cyclase n=1 Tax=Nocardioides sp. TaxID=35761 RepID=UPI002F410D8D
MTVEGNKESVLRLYELLNQGDVDAVGDLAVDDYEEHDPVPGQGTGKEGAIDRFSLITGALAPHFTIEDLVAEGDRVVVRWTNSGTHVGEFAGIPATGRAFTIAGIDVYRLVDGRLCEHWHVIDQLAMLGQLGLLPEPAGA